MPVRSISRCWMPAMMSLPWVTMPRSSSSSASTPWAITSPLPIWAAGSLLSVRVSSAFSSGQSSISLAIRTSGPFLSVFSVSNTFSGRNWSMPRRSCITSRGETRPEAARDRMRSRSPIAAILCESSEDNSLSFSRASTLSCRVDISAKSLDGMVSHERSRRAPIGEEVLSITSSRVTPPGAAGSTNSRLRTVKRSSQTKPPSSMRDMVLIWANVRPGMYSVSSRRFDSK